MFHKANSIVFAASLLVSGCTDGLNNEKNTGGNNNIEYIGEINTSADTGTENLDNNDVEQLGSTDGDGPKCEFGIMTWGGVVTMSNQLVVTKNPNSPDGWFDTGTTEVLALDFTVVHKECPPLAVSEHSLDFSADTSHGTGWVQTMFSDGIDGLDDAGDCIVESQGSYELDGDTTGNIDFSPIVSKCGSDDPLWIPGGSTLTVRYIANLSGTNSNDSIIYSLQPNSIGVTDGGDVEWMMNEGVSGGTIQLK